MGRLRELAMACLGVVSALAVTEIGLRGLFRAPEENDPLIGPVPMAGATLVWSVEGYGVSHWQAGGLRRPQPPRSGTPDLLVVGDSFTEALQVNDGETFSDRLEQRLTADRARLEVLNVSHSAYSVADHIANAPANRQRFDPRWVIVQLGEADFASEAWVERGFSRIELGEGGIKVIPRQTHPPGRLSFLVPAFQRSSMLQFGVRRANELLRPTDPAALSRRRCPASG